MLRVAVSACRLSVVRVLWCFAFCVAVLLADGAESVHLWASVSGAGVPLGELSWCICCARLTQFWRTPQPQAVVRGLWQGFQYMGPGTHGAVWSLMVVVDVGVLCGRLKSSKLDRPAVGAGTTATNRRDAGDKLIAHHTSAGEHNTRSNSVWHSHPSLMRPAVVGLLSL